MKIGELKKIIHLLPDDIEVTLGEGGATPKLPRWKSNNYGNHDGRFTINCPCCGWESDEEFYPHRQKHFPNRCPKCGILIEGVD